MIFESLWPLAFLLAIPVVVILYLLVPKGTDTPVSSNLLWKKLFYNEQSKTFWEKFLHNLLMYLQIVILLLPVCNVALHILKHLHNLDVCAAVLRPLERAERSGNGGIGVRPGGRDMKDARY